MLRTKEANRGKTSEHTDTQSFQAELRGLCVSDELIPVRRCAWSQNSFRHLTVQVLLKTDPVHVQLVNKP